MTTFIVTAKRLSIAGESNDPSDAASRPAQHRPPALRGRRSAHGGLRRQSRVRERPCRAQPGVCLALPGRQRSGHRHPPVHGDPRMAINMSVWENVEALERFVWQTVHKRFYGAARNGSRKWTSAISSCGGCRPDIGPPCRRRSSGSNIFKRHGANDRAFGWESLPAAKLWKTARCAVIPMHGPAQSD